MIQAFPGTHKTRLRVGGRLANLRLTYVSEYNTIPFFEKDIPFLIIDGFRID